MNGVLWKWTNYYNGWQPRWFVLKDGILSYFRSEDEVHSGSKGSINLSVCDLNVNTYDPSRFEIIIPGEQKYFLKASNTQERQRWIVALGTGKACHIEPEFQMKDRVGDYYLPLKEISFKESELRIYLELMNQQVGSIKSQLSEDISPDVSALNELTATLNAACDTFLSSLKDLVSIAVTSNGASFPDSPPTYIGSPIFSSLPVQNFNRNSHRYSIGASNSLDVEATCCSEKSASIGLTSSRSRRKANFLIDMPHSFVDWSQQIESGHTIATIDYIDSVSSLFHFLEYFDAQPIISFKVDLRTIVKKLSLKYETDPRQFCDLDALIVPDEMNMDSGTFVLRGLHRALSFVECFLISLLKWLESDLTREGRPDVDEGVLKEMLIEAFNSTMKEKLNWLDRGQFSIISQALPSTSRFLLRLISTSSPPAGGLRALMRAHRLSLQQLVIDLSLYVSSLSAVNRRVSALFLAAGIDL